MELNRRASRAKKTIGHEGPKSTLTLAQPRARNAPLNPAVAPPRVAQRPSFMALGKQRLSKLQTEKGIKSSSTKRICSPSSVFHPHRRCWFRANYARRPIGNPLLKRSLPPQLLSGGFKQEGAFDSHLTHFNPPSRPSVPANYWNQTPAKS